MPFKRAGTGGVPQWLEGVRSVMNDPTAGTVDPRTGWGATRMETLVWLRAHGLDADDYPRLCGAFDAARGAGDNPERALEVALRECRT